MSVGLYIHVPFCRVKCPYCDFYSLAGSEEIMELYTSAVCRELDFWGQRLDKSADTLYFGGGTPTLLGAGRLAKILDKARECFGLKGAEITIEANPSADLGEQFKLLRNAGVNRLSLGLQSAVDSEAAALGRGHSVRDVVFAASAAKRAGFDNVSLDLMLGIGGQTLDSVARSVEFCREMGVSHVSAYMLKIEEGTPFFDRRESLRLPDEDEVSEIYLFACDALEKAGFKQYEISNFARDGAFSRHNMKYWSCEEYLGVGPSAHSFIGGRRFYTPRDIEGFLREAQYVDDGPGGGREEYIMLRLRLTEGIIYDDYYKRYIKEFPVEYIDRAKQLAGLVECDDRGMRLTRQGFLVSNSVIGEILLGDKG